MSKIRAIELIKILGSPFIDNETLDLADHDLISLYDDAFKNRVGLLYLEKYRRKNWSNELEKKYFFLKDRERKTLEVVCRLAEKLNEFDPENYIIFKSIKPYPATPNDTDVIWLGDKKQYKEMLNYLLSNGYEFHEWAPQQKTIYDIRGKSFIGHGKKGGIYYIDLYEEISTDYFAYLNKHILQSYIIKRKINDVHVNLLRPEPELAIVLFHNVFPERTFQLEHFYLPLYYFKNKDFNHKIFIQFIFDNKMNMAIKTNLTFIKYLHLKYFDYIPPIINDILKCLGTNDLELNRFINQNFNLPYLFSHRTFWGAFLQKNEDWYSLKSLLIQILKMFNPIFFLDVVRSLKLRFSEKGSYHLE